MAPLTRDELEAGLAHVLESPGDLGVVELLVARPEPGARIELSEAVLDPDVGLVGDCWKTRGSRHTADGSANPLMQLTLVNARAIDLLAGDRTRWALAGDQLYVDLDLGGANVPAGSRLAVGDAVVEVTEQPHTGCAKFAQRFGPDAARFVSSPVGRAHNLRGINARVLRGGVVRPGDLVWKASRSDPVSDHPR